jgi:ubiquitin-small subunit ribosomal protein S27Ae
MGTMKGGTKGERKGKKKHVNKPTSKKYSHYKITGEEVKRDRKHCPRCGPAVFLADHSGRLYCGKCHYTEFSEKK